MVRTGPLFVPLDQDIRNMVLQKIDEHRKGLPDSHGSSGSTGLKLIELSPPLVLVHIELKPRKERYGVDSRNCGSFTLDCLGKLEGLLYVIIVAVLQLVGLQHALYGGIAALGKQSDANVTFDDEVRNVAIQILAVSRYFQRLHQLVLIVNQVNAQEPLVSYKSPQMVEDALGSTIFANDPVLTIGNLKSLVWLE